MSALAYRGLAVTFPLGAPTTPDAGYIQSVRGVVHGEWGSDSRGVWFLPGNNDPSTVTLVVDWTGVPAIVPQLMQPGAGLKWRV
jgi:hypothetical protein